MASITREREEVSECGRYGARDINTDGVLSVTDGTSLEEKESDAHQRDKPGNVLFHTFSLVNSCHKTIDEFLDVGWRHTTSFLPSLIHFLWGPKTEDKTAFCSPRANENLFFCNLQHLCECSNFRFHHSTMKVKVSVTPAQNPATTPTTIPVRRVVSAPYAKSKTFFIVPSFLGMVWTGDWVSLLWIDTLAEYSAPCPRV